LYSSSLFLLVGPYTDCEAYSAASSIDGNSRAAILLRPYAIFDKVKPSEIRSNPFILDLSYEECRSIILNNSKTTKNNIIVIFQYPHSKEIRKYVDVAAKFGYNVHVKKHYALKDVSWQ